MSHVGGKNPRLPLDSVVVPQEKVGSQTAKDTNGTLFPKPYLA